MADEIDSGDSDPFKALKQAIIQEIDDFDEAVAAHHYIRERAEIFASGSYGDDGAIIRYGINEVDGYDFCVEDRLELAAMVEKSFDGCWRSEADFIVAAEYSIAQAKKRFTERHGIEFSREAIDKAAAGFPGNLWKPQEFPA